VLERFYRADVEREVVASLVQSSYRQAVDEHDLFPVAEPIVDNETLAMGKPFRFRAQVEVKPKIDPQDYLGLPLAKKPVDVSDAELAAELEKVRDSMATLEPIEERRVGVAGDWALVDYDLEVEGKKVESLERNRDQPVELTTGEIIKGHVPELRGVEVGQAIDLDFPFPADYRVVELQGKVGRFHVTLKGLRRRNLPTLDDELVKDLDEPGLTNLTQLRERIGNRMREEREAESDRDARQQIVKALVEHNPFEAPPALVSRMAESELRMLAQQIVRSGIDPDSLSIDQAKLRAGAELRIKADLLLEAVAAKEKLEVSEADLEAHFERVARDSEQPLSKVKAQLGRKDQREALNFRVLQDKALAFLRSKATIMAPGTAPGTTQAGVAEKKD
jgi:trigger factor